MVTLSFYGEFILIIRLKEVLSPIIVPSGHSQIF